MKSPVIEDKEEDNRHTFSVKSSWSFILPVAGFILSLLVATIVALVFYHKSQKLIDSKQVKDLKTESAIVETLLNNFYQQNAKDVQFLRHTPPIEAIQSALLNNQFPEVTVWQERLEKIFTELIKTKPSYIAIEYCIKDEVVRSKASVSVVQPSSVAHRLDCRNSEINNSASFRAFLESKHSKATNVYFSDIQLFTSEDKKEIFYVNTVLPVYQNNGVLFGWVAIKADIGLFIDTLKRGPLKDFVFYLANSNDTFFYQASEINSLDFKQYFGELRLNGDNTLDGYTFSNQQKNDAPAAYYRKIILDDVMAMKPIHLVTESHSSQYLSDMAALRNQAFILAVMLALISTILVWIFTHRLIKPLLDLTQNILRYERSGEIPSLSVQRNDEIGALARSFQRILSQVTKNEQDNLEAKTEAEDTSARLQAVLDSIVDAVININEKGKIIAFNRAAEKIFGYSSQEVIGKNVSILMPQRYASKHDGYIKRYLNTNIKQIIGIGRELPAQRKDGEIFAMHLSVSEVKTKEAVIFTGLIRDITVTKLLEKEREASAKKFEEIAQRLEFALSGPGIGVWSYNIGTERTQWDDRMYRLFGYQFGEKSAPESLWEIHIHPDDESRVLADMQNTIKHGEDLNCIFRIILSDNSIRYIQTYAQLIHGETPDNSQVVGTCMDVTEQQTVQQVKQEMLEVAEESSRLKSEFLASMSHEIRTPMNGVIGMLGLLAQSSLNQKQQHQLSLAQSSASSLLTLINDILDFSKIEAGKLDIEEIEFDLHQLFGELVQSMAIRSQEKNVELILDLSLVEKPLVKGDPSRLRQILSNIIGNAVKFTEQGEIVISAQLTVEESNSKLTCHIKDTGIGIRESYIESLFDAFTQVDATTTRKYGGTGLGLAIVKQLCQLMGGDITVNSKLGLGTEFVFSVQLAQEDEQPAYDFIQCLQGQTVLLVDKNETVLETLKRQFKLWKANVFVAIDEVQAIQLAHEQPTISAVFFSSKQGSRGGVEFVKQLRLVPSCQKSHYIMMSSIGDIEESEYLREQGIAYQFPKPIAIADLKTAIETIYMNSGEVNVNKVGSSLANNKKHVDNVKPQLNILIAEDNRVNQAVILGVLNNLQLTADIANNGVEVLQLLAQEKKVYDVILMDCQMPELDGYDTTRAIRKGKAGEHYQDLIIIAMTANAMKGDEQKCLQSGMSDYMTKPIDVDILINKLNKHLESKVTLGKPSVVEAEPMQIVENITIEGGAELWNKQRFYERVSHNDKLVISLLSYFKTEASELKDKLLEEIETANVKEVQKTAHKLVGMCANISVSALLENVKKIEQAAKERDIDALKTLSIEFINFYDKTILSLSQQ
ncbi:PAS domain S-box protein [Thalassotalea ganghwensis]